MESIHPAESYSAVNDLCVITTHFNPCGYQRLKENYHKFRQSLESSGIQLFTVECAFNDTAFNLEKSDNVMQVRSGSVLWQKEKMLNIALKEVLRNFPKVAWIDADVLFSNATWAQEASRLLDDYPIVQVQDQIVQLSPDSTVYEGDLQRWTSFAYDITTNGVEAVKASNGQHGHTGFAWAARREVLEGGLYDGDIIGTGDHVMAHGMLNDLNSPCLNDIFFSNTKSRDYFKDWAEQFYAKMQGHLTFVPGTALHMWHGSIKNRRYRYKAEKLARFGVDPRVDLCNNSDGLWEWNSERPSLHRFVAETFALREEDAV